jgi:hypothetical protein
MHAVYYPYASSRDDNPLVDKHDIEQALGAWSWFWAGVEFVAFLIVGSILAFVLKDSALGGSLLIISGVALLCTILQHRRLPRYSRPQVEAIAADPKAAAAVRDSFDAL